MKEYLKITGVQLVSSDKRAKISGGLYIDYESIENVIKDSYLSLVYEDTVHYFKVTDILIKGEILETKAKEVGYWATYFDNKTGFDLRKLIGLQLVKIDNETIIASIREKSCWC